MQAVHFESVEELMAFIARVVAALPVDNEGAV
jgi:hypothetical protein